ncbi:MAG TPA: DedA family protein [Solirubrobacteraceae bacterium]|nr:DedA family protein [Solirubrobacteraceae bacterium]
MLLAASATDALVTVATHIIRDLGLGGVALLTGSSAVIVVPGTEPTMLFAGFNVYQHHLTLLGIICFGLLGDLVGASIAYAIGYYGSDALEQHGGKIHMGPERLAIAHRWFERYGTPVVVVSRCLPLIRAVFPYAAGVARMPYLRFLPLALLGSIPWIVGLGVLGRAVGSNWPSWRTHLQYVDYAFVVLLLGAIAYVLLRRRNRSGGGPVDGQGVAA